MLESYYRLEPMYLALTRQINCDGVSGTEATSEQRRVSFRL
eukprot:COSAG02_NODE_29076_length_576_cov_1.297694_1_plen_40_part_10